MRLTQICVLAAAHISVAVAADAGTAGKLPRGVGPEFAKFYDGSKGTFACIGHPSTVLKFSQVNDHSCDCPDGSDEPGTPACAHLDPLSPEQPLPGAAGAGATTKTVRNALPGFWCQNEGHVGAYLPFRTVNDGVCDYDLCCDGTEEYAGVGGVQCENRCVAIGKEYRRVEEERRKSKERSAKKRRTMAKEARELRRRVEAKIAGLRDELSELEAKKEELRKKLEEAERSERGKVVRPEGRGGKLGVLLGLAKTRVSELRDALGQVLYRRDGLQERVEELEGILKRFKEEYNPNFNDEGVKTAVKSWEDYAAKAAATPDEENISSVSDEDMLEILKEDGESSGINWVEFQEEAPSDTDILYSFEAYLPAVARDYIHSKLNMLRIWLIENGLLADNPTSAGESRLVTAAREAFQDAEKQVSSKAGSLTEQEGDLGKDYGADDIFRVLKGKCVSQDSGEYEYELCWLDKTTQKSRKGHGHTSMGKFDRIDIETADDEDRADGKSLGKGPRMVLRYENGQHCWNGPNRRTDVWLACAETEEIWRISEAEKCVYRMEVGTPAACDDVQEAGVPSKDEL